MKKLLIILLIVLFVQGCATGYRSEGFLGGYSEIQLDKNVYKVSFKGNAYVSQEKAANFTLLRCAELTLDNGYKYFVIINANSHVKNSTYTTPTISETTGTITQGETHNISKPSSSNTIVCYKEKPDTGFSYNAQFIYDSMIQKYRIKK
jgi:hypothetical protein